ncbi:MAG: SDR family NAD(P)-dependent oxidoreductase [Acidimicrobiales bacterium]
MSTTELPSLAQLVSLEGRYAVVTGAGNGIGRSVALRLAEAGASLLLADRDNTGLEKIEREIRSRFAVQVTTAALDITDSAAVRSVAELASSSAERLDIWVNTAAVWSTTSVVDTTDEAWRYALAIDLDGSFFCAREAARQMLRMKRAGVIVLLSSLSAHRGRVGRSHYVAAKHGVLGLTRSLAAELGPSGIRVVAIAPSVTDTVAAMGDQSAGTDSRLHDEMMSKAVGAIPMGRVGKPDEVARAVLFAVSDLASFMTGSTLHVDGGASAT